jgi:pyruvate/2-oxoglutarate dehydrogenase complex dihydrolipoamide dehydrogenase (E3) component
MSNDYDVLVIGCGTAGSRAASTAAKHGARVVAFEGGERLGGLCILRGCMPTKTLLETAHRLHDIRDATRFGIEVAAPSLDFPAMMNRMRTLVERFRSAKERGVHAGGYELRWGRPRFVDPHTVEVDGERFRGKAIVIATGSRVRELPVEVPADARVVTSDAMFELTEVPSSAIVLGAGAVGLEFATWMARIGTQVTWGSRSPILHRTDPESGEELRRALADEMTVLPVSQLQRVEARPGGGVVATFAPSEGAELRIEADLLLNAIGRVPDYSGLELAAAGLEVVGAGLPHRPTLQTDAADHVFVAGDTTGQRLILHDANLEGAVAGNNAARLAGALAGDPEPLAPVPGVEVTFTDPAYANVGRSPLTLEATGTPFVQATKRFPEQGRGIVMGDRYGLLRLVACPRTAHILGCQIVSRRADDLIHIPAAVMALGGTVDQMHRIPWYHPTLAEAFIEVTRELSAKVG